MKRRDFIKTTGAAALFTVCPRLCRAADDEIEHVIINPDNPAICHDPEKCAGCGKCLETCKNEMGVWGSYGLKKTKGKGICIHCGQCTAGCENEAVTARPEQDAVKAAIAKPGATVIVYTSPSVRVSLGEEFGAKPGTNVEGQIVAALRKLGVHIVLDTTFAADLTITEEASELLRRIKEKRPLPQFTSCCPAWVKFAETFYPEHLPNISTSRSPIGMMGSVVKTWFAEKRGLDPKNIFAVALTPCTAKKFEIRRPGMETDAVITVRELAQWLKQSGIDPLKLDPAPYDDLMGRGTGAGVIFGNTGGVMEAALRTAYFYLTQQNPPAALLAYEPVRGMDGVRSAQVAIPLPDAPLTVNVAIVHGTANARKLIAKIKSGEAKYDFIEVMACRGGCIGGGGQPRTAVPTTDEIRQARIKGLYALDTGDAKRLSHENPQVQAVYKEFFGAPLSEKAHRLLHTIYQSRAADLG